MDWIAPDCPVRQARSRLSHSAQKTCSRLLLPWLVWLVSPPTRQCERPDQQASFRLFFWQTELCVHSQSLFIVVLVFGLCITRSRSLARCRSDRVTPLTTTIRVREASLIVIARLHTVLPLVRVLYSSASRRPKTLHSYELGPRIRSHMPYCDCTLRL